MRYVFYGNVGDYQIYQCNMYDDFIVVLDNKIIAEMQTDTELYAFLREEGDHERINA